MTDQMGSTSPSRTANRSSGHPVGHGAQQRDSTASLIDDQLPVHGVSQLFGPGMRQLGHRVAVERIAGRRIRRVAVRAHERPVLLNAIALQHIHIDSAHHRAFPGRHVPQVGVGMAVDDVQPWHEHVPGLFPRCRDKGLLLNRTDDRVRSGPLPHHCTQSSVINWCASEESSFHMRAQASVRSMMSCVLMPTTVPTDGDTVVSVFQITFSAVQGRGADAVELLAVLDVAGRRVLIGQPCCRDAVEPKAPDPGSQPAPGHQTPSPGSCNRPSGSTARLVRAPSPPT